MMVGLALLLVAATGLQATAQDTWTVAEWSIGTGEEVRSDGTGALVLAEVSSDVNLARGKVAVDHTGGVVKITDGNYKQSFWNSLRQEAFNFYVQVDLEQPRLVNRVVVAPIEGNTTEFMKGYSIQTSLDNIVFREQVLNIRNLDNTIDTTFAPAVARYVRVQVKAVDNVHTVKVSELEVYGGGFVSSGTFTSDATDFGARWDKNLGRVRWEADVSPGTTELSLQFRTGSSRVPDATWSEWTTPSASSAGADGVLLELPEPRRYFQYQALLATANPEATPRLTRMEVQYRRPLAAAVTGVVALVGEDGVPQLVGRPDTVEVTVGEEQRFVFRVQVDVGTGDGFDLLRLTMPNRSQVTRVLVDDSELAPTAWTLGGDTTTVELGFVDAITSDADIHVHFTTVLFDEVDVFGGAVISQDSPGNPQQMEPDAAVGNALKIYGTGLVDGVLDRGQIAVEPNPFSPNGDGTCDVVRVRYELAKISVPRPVALRIYDLTGRPVREIEALQKSGSHLIEWDGRDDDGDTVPPGIYLFNLDIDSGEGVQASGAIGVSY